MVLLVYLAAKNNTHIKYHRSGLCAFLKVEHIIRVIKRLCGPYMFGQSDNIGVVIKFVESVHQNYLLTGTWNLKCIKYRMETTCETLFCIPLSTLCCDQGSPGEHITNTIIIVTHNEKIYFVGRSNRDRGIPLSLWWLS